MRGRRALSLGLASAAVLAAVALLVVGARCGMRSTSAECAVDEPCAPPVEECTPYIYPMAWPLIIAGLAAVGAAWIEAPLALMGLGVAIGAIGAIFGFSLGPWGIGIGLLVTGAGAALGRTRPIVSVGAFAATMLPLVLLVTILTYYQSQWSGFGKVRAPPLALVYGAAFTPALLWATLVALSRRQRITS